MVARPEAKFLNAVHNKPTGDMIYADLKEANREIAMIGWVGGVSI